MVSQVIREVAIKKLIIIFYLLLCSIVTCYADITGVSGTVSDTGSIVISDSGSGFGSNSLNLEWAGANIEAGTDGNIFSKTGWSNSVSFPERARYDNSRSYSGSQSIVFDSTTYNDGRFKVAYDWGSEPSFFYISWMVYIDKGGADGQWKMLRIDWENDVNDTGPEVVMFNWTSGDHQFFVRRYGADISQRFYPNYYPSGGAWYRLEIYAKPSSSPGVSDGSIQYWEHIPGTAIHFTLNETSLETAQTGETDFWRYLVFQNYIGNGLSSNAKVWNDDYYISDTKARVEIGDASVWGDCTHREIQIPTAWATGEITATVNLGTFANDETAYLFVVDSDGTATAGYEITIGAASTDPIVVMDNSGQTVSSTPLSSITGTATATTGRTITGVTSSGLTVTPDDAVWDEQIETFNVSNTDLSEGLNTFTFIATDDQSDQGQDDFTVTYTPDDSSASLKGTSGNFNLN